MQHFLKDLTIMLSGWLSMQPTPTARLLEAAEGKVRIGTAN